MRLALGLVHYPILDQHKRVIATNVTNLDIHDIARACRVYGVERYYVIHPMRDQLMFVERVLDHWRVGEGLTRNPMRATALTMVQTAESVDQAARDWGGEVKLVTTHPRPVEGSKAVSFKALRAQIDSGTSDQKLMLLFGTGFGLTEDMMRATDYLLEPIRGQSVDDYRHLSVRSAVSICLDRLLGA